MFNPTSGPSIAFSADSCAPHSSFRMCAFAAACMCATTFLLGHMTILSGAVLGHITELSGTALGHITILSEWYCGRSHDHVE